MGIDREQLQHDLVDLMHKHCPHDSDIADAIAAISSMIGVMGFLAERDHHVSGSGLDFVDKNVKFGYVSAQAGQKI